MGNTFVDGQEKIGMDSALDFITVRNSGGRLVFMGERKNIKCFDRLKKVSERVFETLEGQTYRFLDKMPEPEKPKEPEITISPEMQARADAAYQIYLAGKADASKALPVVPQPLTFEEQIQKDWKTLPGIRAEFVSQASYAAYCRAVRDGRTKVYGRG